MVAIDYISSMFMCMLVLLETPTWILSKGEVVKKKWESFPKCGWVDSQTRSKPIKKNKSLRLFLTRISPFVLPYLTKTLGWVHIFGKPFLFTPSVISIKQCYISNQNAFLPIHISQLLLECSEQLLHVWELLHQLAGSLTVRPLRKRIYRCPTLLKVMPGLRRPGNLDAHQRALQCVEDPVAWPTSKSPPLT